jgi:hypothetical protein
MRESLPYDILFNIVALVENDDFWVLPALARVNRMVSNIALNRLWNAVNLYPLVKTIHGNLWQEYEIDYGDETCLCKERKIVSIGMA